MLLFSSAYYIQKLIFTKNYFRNIIRVSNSLDTDQDRHSVGPDPVANCFKRFFIQVWDEQVYILSSG